MFDICFESNHLCKHRITPSIMDAWITSTVWHKGKIANHLVGESFTAGLMVLRLWPLFKQGHFPSLRQALVTKLSENKPRNQITWTFFDAGESFIVPDADTTAQYVGRHAYY